jgi:3-oxoadipate enol-lactonase
MNKGEVRMNIEANGISFNTQVEGAEGAPWITFSNSLACNLSMWDGQVAALRDDYRILRYDTRGHGGTAVPGGPYSFDMLVGDVIGLWDALGIERGHFIGLSLGGMTALGLALGHAGRLSSITVCNARAEAPPEFRDLWDTRIATVGENGMEAIIDATLERWFTPGFAAGDPPVLDRVRDMIRATAPRGYIGCARALQGLDYLPRLGGISLPALFIAGAGDGATPPEGMRAMHQAVANSQYVELDPAAHISNLEQPEAFNDALTTFLAENPA